MRSGWRAKTVRRAAAHVDHPREPVTPVARAVELPHHQLRQVARVQRVAYLRARAAEADVPERLPPPRR